MSEEICITLASFDFPAHTQEELSAVRFDEESFFAAGISAGVILLQTCNRVAILIHGTAKTLQNFLREQNREGFVIYEDEAALHHLSKLAAGVESFIIGEDQILGQLKSSLLLAEKHHASDTVTTACIQTAINLGISVRQQTAINRGAVSIGSAAVLLAEEICGDLSGKNILVVGGGELGKLVTKSLAEKNLRAIYVTNRTYENAVRLAEEVHGRAMHLDQLYTCIGLSDVVISCTAAPHAIIRKAPLAEVMENRFWPLDEAPRPLTIIDIAQPFDVEKSCAAISGVRLFTIDDLKHISEQNMTARRNECERAEEIVAAFQPEFIRILRKTAAEDVLAELYTWAEQIRSNETSRALLELEHGKNPADVVAHLTKALTKKLLDEAASAIRSSAEEKSLDTAENIVKSITGKTECTRKHE